MSNFCTNEQISLEKKVHNRERIHQTDLNSINFVYEIDRCIEWITTNNFNQVCLQFPDHMLIDAVEVSLKLQEALNHPVYIVGDTAYESCCLDFIAAAHVKADAIIHYGSICFSQTTKNLPYLNIYEKSEIDVMELENILLPFLSNREEVCFLLVDTPYLYKINAIRNIVSDKCINVLRQDEEINYSMEGLYIYIGSNSRKLKNIYFSLNQNHNLFSLDPSNTKLEITHFTPPPVTIKRRYYLAERIKDSQIFGIVMGTLAIDNYLKILDRIKKLLKLNRKKYYVISVGKISPAKLANFPEMDVYIVITCAMNEVYDSKEFYKPIVTPYDVEIAFNPGLEDISFSYDYNSFLNKVSDDSSLKPVSESDVSLLTGNLRSIQFDDAKQSSDEKIVLKTSGTLIESSKFGAGYLAERSWKGLEQNVGQTQVKLAKEGRAGIAQFYVNESHMKN
ncbi:hypothetical protein WA026_002726 [Henosepilachna vigintioctopunctata]|uniref:2-(3-amino-3-carboxypropyl)histidine synthase n=1 Tax=Henosepilachna vigintioctopunctata TaxID=420089 RepID=A0AAW1U4S5_9CUCU